MKKLTLSEIAAYYNRCPKTFLKYVHQLGIPHIKLGRDRLFDKDEVERFLKQLNESIANEKIDLGPKKVAKDPRPATNTARYEQMLGLR